MANSAICNSTYRLSKTACFIKKHSLVMVKFNNSNTSLQRRREMTPIPLHLQVKNEIQSLCILRHMLVISASRSSDVT